MKDIIGLINGGVIEVHDPAVCEGQSCCVHNPSDHPLRDAPLDWWPLNRIMVRTCGHGVDHPDPDDVRVRAERWAFASHTCDGCCHPGQPAPRHYIRPDQPPPGQTRAIFPHGETP